jgi:hypothetical protein
MGGESFAALNVTVFAHVMKHLAPFFCECSFIIIKADVHL